jgi:glycosyltransferase involved in cell wall biosynthesis
MERAEKGQFCLYSRSGLNMLWHMTPQGSHLIDSHPGECAPESKFSILIPTWNNLLYLKLCVGSIRRHSHFPHQIIVHVNDGSDGTLDWVKEQKLDHTHSAENVGVCLAVNMGRTLARTDYIAYMNDDMVVCPEWDRVLWEEIQRLKSKWFFLSATMLEPYPTNSKPVLAPYSYGTTAEEFDEARLLKEYMTMEKPDWCGATRPPNVVHKDLWDLVGGYSVEFSPGLYSDPDFSMKLWKVGVREFKGLGQSRVYHFVSKSLGRIKKNDGRTQFLHKWGVTSSTVTKYYLRIGEPYTGPLELDESDPTYRKALLKNKIQKALLFR